LHWFGGREIGIYLYIAFAVFVIVATNTYEAIFNVPKFYFYQARVLGATKFQIFRTVVFFAIQPEMIGSLRNVLGLCWAFSLGAEYLSARSGIGYLIYQSYLYADMGKLIVFAGIYAIYGILCFSLSQKMFAYIKRWKN
jgi:ABC-type nitrate/sulfonate/bicarbonate transport system permease component